MRTTASSRVGTAVASVTSGASIASAGPAAVRQPDGESAATQAAIDTLLAKLAPGDLVIDGGNSDHRDSRRRAAALAQRRIAFADCGVSGGVWGLANGYCLMFGASDEVAPRVVAGAAQPMGGSWGADGSRVYLPGYEHREDQLSMARAVETRLRLAPLASAE